jgi:hypothetical protein
MTGHGLENHRARVVHAAAVLVTTVEGRTMARRLSILASRWALDFLRPCLGFDELTHRDLFGVEVHAVDQLLDRLGAHATFEVLRVA